MILGCFMAGWYGKNLELLGFGIIATQKENHQP